MRASDSEALALLGLYGRAPGSPWTARIRACSLSEAEY